jgi:ribosome-associated protein
MQEKDLAHRISQILYDRKAQDIVVLQVPHLTVLADYLVIASGTNPIQVRTLAEHVEEEIAALGVQVRRREGEKEGRWVVLDYLSVIVHIFHPEDRGYYRLERLWDDGRNRLPLPFYDDVPLAQDQP